MFTKKKIGVLMGGISAEREVSLRSGDAIYRALKGLGYNTVAIDVGPDLCNALKSEGIEIAFIALHGGYGENGAVQGLLEVNEIPYTGSGVLASALAMDKEASKKIFRYHKIPVPPFVIIKSNELQVTSKENNSLLVTRYSSLVNFDMPWVVKPVAQGSSVGVSIVRDPSNFNSALETVFSFGTKGVAEKYIEGKEVHIGVLNDRVIGGVEVRPSLEFYNFEAKYTAGLTDYILPPEIDKDTYERAKDIALSSHRALDCKGATRVDLRIDNAGDPYVLEVNTIPGMTETSLLPKIARYAGIDFPQLIEEILREAYVEDS